MKIEFDEKQLILNMDEIPIYLDMYSDTTIDFIGYENRLQRKISFKFSISYRGKWMEKTPIDHNKGRRKKNEREKFS